MSWTPKDLGWTFEGDWLLLVGRTGDELIFRDEHLANVHHALDSTGAPGYGDPRPDRTGLTRLCVTGLDSLTLPGIRVLDLAPALAAA